HPAINRSVYAVGCDVPVFRANGMIFGIVICNDSNFAEPAKLAAARGAKVLFVPTNNGLPLKRAPRTLVAEARRAAIARAAENGLGVVRADVAGSNGTLMSYGSTGVVDPGGKVVRTAVEEREDFVIVEIDERSRSGTALVAGARHST